MQRRCYKRDVFIPRLERALGIKAGPSKCYVVDAAAMQKVMRRAGWNRSQAVGVVGFHRKIGNENKIYVLDKAPWTSLHEHIHALGINSDVLSQFVAEGLTEAIAQEIKTGPDEHRPTYPTEYEWVTTRLLPLLGMTPTELGRHLVQGDNMPRTLAALVVKADPGLDEGKLRREFRAQNRTKPSFNRMGVTRWHRAGQPPDLGWSIYSLNRQVPPTRCSPLTSVGFTLMATGALLLIPELLRTK